MVVAILAACVALETWGYKRLVPTGRASNLREFLVWQSSCTRFSQVDVKGERHVVAYGPVKSFLLIASGTSAYEFDPDGKLVDWTPDIGDDDRFGKRWNRTSALSREEVERLAKTIPSAKATTHYSG